MKHKGFESGSLEDRQPDKHKTTLHCRRKTLPRGMASSRENTYDMCLAGAVPVTVSSSPLKASHRLSGVTKLLQASWPSVCLAPKPSRRKHLVKRPSQEFCTRREESQDLKWYVLPKVTQAYWKLCLFCHRIAWPVDGRTSNRHSWPAKALIRRERSKTCRTERPAGSPLSGSERDGKCGS